MQVKLCLRVTKWTRQDVFSWAQHKVGKNVFSMKLSFITHTHSFTHRVFIFMMNAIYCCTCMSHNNFLRWSCCCCCSFFLLCSLDFPDLSFILFIYLHWIVELSIRWTSANDWPWNLSAIYTNECSKRTKMTVHFSITKSKIRQILLYNRIFKIVDTFNCPPYIQYMYMNSFIFARINRSLSLQISSHLCQNRKKNEIKQTKTIIASHNIHSNIN